MKKNSNNTTWVLVAILSFLVGVMLIGAFAMQLRHREEAKVQAALEEEQAEQERLEALAKAQEEEEERLQNASSVRTDEKADAMPEVDVDKALGSDLSHIDLSSYVQDMDGLVKQLDATEVSGSEGTVYTTSDKSITVTRLDENTHQVEITAETAYSLYHIFINMFQTDATEYLQSKGYQLSNRNGQTCYRIDDYKVLYLKFDGTRVVNIRLEVDSSAQAVE
jgi:hypothetical protein